MTSLPIVCTLPENELQERKTNLLDTLAGRATHVEPLASGYEFRFAPDTTIIALIAEAIERERTCCRFLQFDLRVTSGEGPITLAITGPEGTKAFLRDAFGIAE